MIAVKTDPILGFILAEVERQGFRFKGTRERIHNDALRVNWMLDAWRFAQAAAPTVLFPGEIQVIGLGFTIEPESNRKGYRDCNVRVGHWVAPHFDLVPKLMSLWVDAIKDPALSPDEAYLEFERIHPFRDGNGRTGKILHNWLNKSLDNPVLVRDFFGGGVP